MIPDYQAIMRPVLECALHQEVKIGHVVEELADKFALTTEERDELLPSGRQTRFANRVHWAKSHLKQAGLGPVDIYLSQRIVAARVMTAR